LLEFVFSFLIGGRGVKLLEMEKAIEMLLSRVMIQTSGACCDARLRAQMLLALTPVARAVGACVVAQGLASS
jgi:hypothetical protein